MCVCGGGAICPGLRRKGKCGGAKRGEARRQGRAKGGVAERGEARRGKAGQRVEGIKLGRTGQDKERL